MFLKNILISFLLVAAVLIFPGNLIAQDAKPAAEPPKEEQKEAPETVQEKVKEQEAVQKEVEEKEEVSKKTLSREAGDCTCVEPIEKALSKAYISLEEDEWPKAIKVCTDAVNKVKELEKTCKCPVIPVYKDVANAYLSYAKGGEILDGEEEIDCIKAVKLYDDAIKLFEKSVPMILNEKLKQEASLIADYCSEEKEFVEDECS